MPLHFLSYPPRNCILQHLDPNIRLHLSSRTPSFYRSTAPLRINDLSLANTAFLINDTEYKLGVVRHYRNITPAFAKSEDAEGGVIYDVGRFADLDPRMTLRDQDGRPLSIEELVDLDRSERRLGEVLDQLSMMKRKMEVNCNVNRAQMLALEAEVVRLQKTIHRYNERKAISESELVELIRLTIKKGDVKTVEHVFYSRPLRYAYTYFANKFLMEKRNFVDVNHLKFHNNIIFNPLYSLKFKVRNLTMRHGDNWDVARQLLAPQSYPLLSVKVILRRENEDPIVVSAQKLIVMRGVPFEQAVIKNHRVHFNSLQKDWSRSLNALEAMYKMESRVEKVYSMDLEYDNSIRNFLTSVGEQNREVYPIEFVHESTPTTTFHFYSRRNEVIQKGSRLKYYVEVRIMPR